MVCVEASKTARPATVEWVERMIGKHADLPTDKVVLYSDRGFTIGALEKGRAHNVALISAEDLAEADSTEKVLGGLKTIWPKILTVQPVEARVHVAKSNGSRVWFRAEPDVQFFLVDGTALASPLRLAVDQVLGQSLGEIAQHIDLRVVAESTERAATMEFPLWWICDDADGEGAFRPVYVSHRDDKQVELHRIEAVELVVRIQITVSEADLVHARLGSVTVAYGEFASNAHTGLFVVSRGPTADERATLKITPLVGGPVALANEPESAWTVSGPILALVRASEPVCARPAAGHRPTADTAGSPPSS